MIKRVLIIDDDEAIRKVFLLALEGNEFQTDTAASGKTGLTMVNQVEYDLIFLDLKMPGMDGVETLRKIKAVNAQIPVYIITAFAGEYFAELEKIRNESIDFELVHKPIGSAQILQITRGVLNGPVVLD